MEKSGDHFKNLHEVKHKKNFDVNLTSSPREVMNITFDRLTRYSLLVLEGGQIVFHIWATLMSDMNTPVHFTGCNPPGTSRL